MIAPIITFFNYALKGIGQVMLQENVLTGIFFLAGIFYGSTTMGIAAFVASCCGTLTAVVLKFKKSETEKGLYGFSPALVGVASLVFFKSTIIVWLLIIVGSVVAAIVQHWFIKKKIPVFTLPFVLVSWCIIYLAGVLLSLPENVTAIPFASTLNYAYIFKGFGQVIFQGSTISGVLFFLGVLICSPAAAVFGLLGSLLAGLLGSLLGVPVMEVMFGLSSFNAVLCAIVFAGWKSENILWAFISIVIAVLISMLMNHFRIIQLTFPFVASACICTIIKKYATTNFAVSKTR